MKLGSFRNFCLLIAYFSLSNSNSSVSIQFSSNRKRGAAPTPHSTAIIGRSVPAENPAPMEPILNEGDPPERAPVMMSFWRRRNGRTSPEVHQETVSGNRQPLTGVIAIPPPSPVLGQSAHPMERYPTAAWYSSPLAAGTKTTISTVPHAREAARSFLSNRFTPASRFGAAGGIRTSSCWS